MSRANASGPSRARFSDFGRRPDRLVSVHPPIDARHRRPDAGSRRVLPLAGFLSAPLLATLVLPVAALLTRLTWHLTTLLVATLFLLVHVASLARFGRWAKSNRDTTN